MKRHGNLWEKILDPDNIREAYNDARRGKTLLKAVRFCDRHLEETLAGIRETLATKTFRTSPYRAMVIFVPKRREIYKLPFYPDRIVHHCLMRVLEPIWTGLFSPHSYACIKRRGIHAASRLTMSYVRRYRYCLKMDISKFYPSVDQDVLYGIVAHKIKCPDTLWLMREIIYSYAGGKNIPIGNYTSQWMGNLYLNELDQWLRQTHGVTAYVRYCDDFCIFGDDKRRLHTLAGEIETFLRERLRLTLSKNDVFPTSQGVDFLGYRHFPDHILLRKATATRMKRRLRSLPEALVKGRVTFDQYRSTLASVSGWLRWANTYHLQLNLRINELREVIDNGRNPGEPSGTEAIRRFCGRPSAPRGGETEDRGDPQQRNPGHRVQDQTQQIQVGDVPDDPGGDRREEVRLFHRVDGPGRPGQAVREGSALPGHG
jgi:RNA-directed DNA polymerase